MKSYEKSRNLLLDLILKSHEIPMGLDISHMNWIEYPQNEINDRLMAYLPLWKYDFVSWDDEIPNTLW